MDSLYFLIHPETWYRLEVGDLHKFNPRNIIDIKDHVPDFCVDLLPVHLILFLASNQPKSRLLYLIQGLRLLDLHVSLNICGCNWALHLFISPLPFDFWLLMMKFLNFCYFRSDLLKCFYQIVVHKISAFLGLFLIMQSYLSMPWKLSNSCSIQLNTFWGYILFEK